MRRLLVVTAMIAALAAPSAALAADPTGPAAPLSAAAPSVAVPPVMRTWEIVAIETSGGAIKIQGKLGLAGGLFASVGCNSLSAPVVSFDGTTLTIGGVVTTLIGCRDDVAKAEEMLATVLRARTLTLTSVALTSTEGRIDLTPVDVPQPIGSAAPDEGSGSGVGVTADTCAKVLGSEWVIGVDGGTTPGSGGGAAGSTGSGSTGSGSTGSGVASPPIEIQPAPPAVYPLPAPGTTPAPATAEPGLEASGVPVPPPATTAKPIPVDPIGPGAPVDPGVPVPMPSLVAPAPVGSPSLTDLCRALLVRIQDAKGGIPGSGTDTIGGGPAAIPAVPTASENAFSVSGVSSDLMAGVFLGGLVGLVLGVAVGWRERGRRPRGEQTVPAAEESTLG